MRATRGGQPLTASCLLALSLLLISVLADEPRLISKRQAPNGAQSSSMATSSVQMTGGGPASAKPAASGPPMEPPGLAGADQEPEEAGRGPAPTRRRRPKPQVARRPVAPPARRGRYEEEEYHHEDGDCYDDDDDNDYEAGNLFQSMAARPMRQMSRMMGHMFDQMQGMSSDMMFNGRGGRGNVVSAAASSSSYDDDGDDDGYSRTASIVNNNGRTRGIVSETRNGRTKTQRIGDD